VEEAVHTHSRTRFAALAAIKARGRFEAAAARAGICARRLLSDPPGSGGRVSFPMAQRTPRTSDQGVPIMSRRLNTGTINGHGPGALSLWFTARTAVAAAQPSVSVAAAVAVAASVKLGFAAIACSASNAAS